MAEAGATHYLRKTGWLKVYRSERGFAALKPEFDLAAQFGLPLQALDTAGAQALEPSLKPVFAHAVFWPQAASVSNPLGVTRAYAARFAALGGVTLQGDARSLHRAGNRWRVETNEGGDRRARGRGRARSLGSRFAGAAWIEIAADGQARLSPALPARKAMPRWRGRCSTPASAM